MNGATTNSNLGDNWLSARQLRLYAARLQGRSGLLPLTTWKRWKRQLQLSSESDYSPDESRLVLEFCQWLQEGGSVHAFQLNHGIIQEKSDDKQQQQWTQPQSQQRSASGGVEISFG